jgi:hypothetical protein
MFNVASKGVLTNMFDEGGVDVSDLEYQFGYSEDKTSSDAQLRSVTENFVDLNEKAYELGQLEASIQDVEYGLNQLYILSRNPNLYPEDIKEQARQIVSTALANGDNPKLSSFYRKREEILTSSKRQVTEAKLLGKNILKVGNYSAKENFGFTSSENVEVYNMMSAEAEDLIHAVEMFEASYSKDEVEQMLQLMQQLYFSLQNSTFTYNTNALAEGDRTNINIQFIEIPPVNTIESDDPIFVDSEETDLTEETEEYDFYERYSLQKFYKPQEKVVARTKSFKVKVSGGLKIDPSVGITFPSYFGSAKDYFTRGDTLIVETKGDNYIPNISAFVNFYPYTGKAVNFGGTFGIGIPIKGSKIAPNFFVGGAMILGSKYRVTLTAGMATGPVTRLANGYEVGQKLEIYDDMETTTKYAIGFYSGLSFSLGVGK